MQANFHAKPCITIEKNIAIIQFNTVKYTSSDHTFQIEETLDYCTEIIK